MILFDKVQHVKGLTHIARYTTMHMHACTPDYLYKTVEYEQGRSRRAYSLSLCLLNNNNLIASLVTATGHAASRRSVT